MSIVFSSPRVILCEGSSDKAVFDNLIRSRGLPDIQVYFPLGANDKTGGNTSFGRSLRANRTSSTSNFEVVKSVLIVSDNDNAPPESFAKIQNQLRDAGYGVPDDELVFVTSPNDAPSVAIMMLPLEQQPGNLETVCLPAIEAKWNTLIEPLNQFTTAAPANGWSVGQKAKMRVQCLLAATCEPNPYVTLGGIYSEHNSYHPPLDNSAFDAIAAFLAAWDTHLP